MTILVANGCSHTAGSEIEYTNQFSSYENAWPRWLADSMGWGWINIAEAGSSNERIRRSTIEWLINNLELSQNYKSEELVVIIMWSGIDRFEVWHNELQQLRSYTGLSTVDSNVDFPLELAEYIKYRTIIDDRAVVEYKNLFDIYLTARYLESLNIKYYFLNAMHIFVDPIGYNQPGRSLDLVEKYKSLYEIYGDRIKKHLGFNNAEERFWQYMRDNKIPFSKHDPRDTHYDANGHKFWAKYVKTWIEKIDNTSS